MGTHRLYSYVALVFLLAFLYRAQWDFICLRLLSLDMIPIWGSRRCRVRIIMSAIWVDIPVGIPIPVVTYGITYASSEIYHWHYHYHQMWEDMVWRFCTWYTSMNGGSMNFRYIRYEFFLEFHIRKLTANVKQIFQNPFDWRETWVHALSCKLSRYLKYISLTTKIHSSCIVKSRLLMFWRRSEQIHQRSWHWHSFPGIFGPKQSGRSPKVVALFLQQTLVTI